MNEKDPKDFPNPRPPQKEAPLKTLLVAEDDRPTQNVYRIGMRGLASFRTVVVSNGLEALNFIKQESVNILVTDLNMPILDGFSLIATVGKRYPQIPIIVMTSLNESEHKNLPLQLGALRIFPKPVRMLALIEEIKSASLREPDGIMRGLGINNLLQLMEWERKTATMMVKSKNQIGYLYIKNGALIHASLQDLEGLEAANLILSFDDPTIEFFNQCRVAQSINLPLTEILLNDLLIRDAISQKIVHDRLIFPRKNEPE